MRANTWANRTIMGKRIGPYVTSLIAVAILAALALLLLPAVTAAALLVENMPQDARAHVVESPCDPTFNIAPSPNAETGGSLLKSVSAVSSDDVWAAGSSAVFISNTLQTHTLIEHWDGSQWSVVPSPNTTSTTNILFGVSAIAPNDAWAVGYCECGDGSRREQSLIMHWDGTQWSIVASPSIPSGYHYLNSVSAVSANDVWAVGTNLGSTLVVHWDGSQWSVVPSPNAGNANYLNGVSALNANDVWAVGYYYNLPPDQANRTLTLHWNGVAWSVVSSPNAPPDPQGVPSINQLNSVSVLSSGDVWSVGSYFIQQRTPNRTLILHWNANVWSIVPSPNPGSSTDGNVLRGVSAVASDDVWAVGVDSISNLEGQPLIERWDGSQWGVVPSPLIGSGQNTLWGVDALASNDIWAVGERSGGQTLALHSGVFSDVGAGSTYYQYITCLAGRGILGGYSDCTFRPGNNITRGQLSKIVSSSAGLNDPPGAQMFTDVLPSSTFYDWVQRLASRGYIGGYACGGVGEPCDGQNRPYFRPGNNATRGQISKIVSSTAGYIEPAGAQIFEDVPLGSTFYDWVQRLASRGYIGGYPCGGAGEPCGSGNRPYFRPGNNATRGQTSKIVANTFFPNCQPR